MYVYITAVMILPIYYGGTPMRHRKTACFEALVLEPNFAQSCGRFLLLYCILGWQSSLQASFHGKMQNVKLPVSNTCGLHMFKQWSNLLSGPVKQGNKVSLWRHSENRGEDAGVPRAPFKPAMLICKGGSRAYKDFSCYACL